MLKKGLSKDAVIQELVSSQSELDLSAVHLVSMPTGKVHKGLGDDWA